MFYRTGFLGNFWVLLHISFEGGRKIAGFPYPTIVATSLTFQSPSKSSCARLCQTLLNNILMDRHTVEC